MDAIKSVKNVMKDMNLMPNIIVLRYQLDNHSQKNNLVIMTNNLNQSMTDNLNQSMTNNLNQSMTNNLNPSMTNNLNPSMINNLNPSMINSQFLKKMINNQFLKKMINNLIPNNQKIIKKMEKEIIKSGKN